MNAILTLLKRKRPTARGDEAGMAMIMVILVSMVLLLIPIGLATAVEAQLPLARHDQNFTSALAAAQSGAQDYLNRLNADTSYWLSSLANTTSNTAPSPVDGNKALLGWVPVSSVVPSSLVEGYCYTVDQTTANGTYTTNSSISSVQGIVELTVYGYAGAGGNLPAATAGANPCLGTVPRGGVERVIGVDLRQIGFLDYLEFTDLELVDQNWYDQQQGKNITDCYNNTNTGHFVYNYNDDASDCGPLDNYWTTGSVLDGPVRSNDDYYLCGTPEFEAAIVSDDPTAKVGPNGGKYWTDPYGQCGTDNPVFDGLAAKASPNPGTISGGQGLIVMPSTDSAVLSYAQSSTGCYYVGPTDIQLQGSQMVVVSPMSSSLSDASRCVSPLTSGVPTPISIPAGGVIYVDNTAANCSTIFGSSTLNWALSPALPAGDSCTTTHGPGDVFMQGTVTGGLTVVSADNVFVTGDLTYTNGEGSNSQDVLGVIANNYIEIDHPVNSSGNNLVGAETFYNATVNGHNVNVTVNGPADYQCSTAGAMAGSSGCNTPKAGTQCTLTGVLNTQHGQLDCNVTIDAALLSLNHSVGVQNYGTGNPFGTLNVNGALAQEYMDIEGTFGSNQNNYITQNVPTPLLTGMNSVYTYDQRLAHLSPPHFLDPSYAQWKNLNFEECQAAGCQTFLNTWSQPAG